jgi:hypothetical protein
MTEKYSEEKSFHADWRIRRKDAVATSDLGEEIVVLDLEGGRYFGLEEVGAFVWRLLAEEPTVEQIESAIVERYEVPQERCASDLGELLAGLHFRGLIQTEVPQGPR